MIANKETRASLKARLWYSITTAGFFTFFFDSLDYFIGKEPFHLWESVISFLLFAVMLLVMSYYFLTKKVKQ